MEFERDEVRGKIEMKIGDTIYVLTDEEALELIAGLLSVVRLSLDREKRKSGRVDSSNPFFVEVDNGGGTPL